MEFIKLKNLGCILKENKNLKGTMLLDIKIIHRTQTFRITQRTGVISRYFVDDKGFDFYSDVCKYITNKINKNLKGEKNYGP